MPRHVSSATPRAAWRPDGRPPVILTRAEGRWTRPCARSRPRNVGWGSHHRRCRARFRGGAATELQATASGMSGIATASARQRQRPTLRRMRSVPRSPRPGVMWPAGETCGPEQPWCSSVIRKPSHHSTGHHTNPVRLSLNGNSSSRIRPTAVRLRTRTHQVFNLSRQRTAAGRPLKTRF